MKLIVIRHTSPIFIRTLDYLFENSIDAKVSRTGPRSVLYDTTHLNVDLIEIDRWIDRPNFTQAYAVGFSNFAPWINPCILRISVDLDDWLKSVFHDDLSEAVLFKLRHF